MKKDTQVTDIIFRVDTTKDFKGTVYALFPHEVCDHKGNVSSYQHIGQHSGANYLGCIATSRLATPTEYADLKKEMEGLGYNIKVVSRRNHEKFLVSYRQK